MDSVREEWEYLSGGSSATIFQRFAWNRLAAEVFGEREAPNVLVARRDAGVVILPLALRKDGSASLLGETLFDYRDMLSTGDRELELAALAEAASFGRSLDVTALTAKAVSRWEPLHCVAFASAPRVARSFSSADDLRAAHRRLGRHSRRIAARGVTFRRREGGDAEFLRELYQRKAAQPDSLFADPLRCEFMERICGIERERCEVFCYEKGSDLIAAIVTFQGARTRHFYTVYYDTAWAEFSPGQVLLYEATLETLAEDLDCDYMTGEYPYKMRLANDSVPLMRVQCTAQEWKDALEQQAREAA